MGRIDRIEQIYSFFTEYALILFLLSCLSCSSCFIYDQAGIATLQPVYSILYETTGSLTAPCAAHAAYNLFLEIFF